MSGENSMKKCDNCPREYNSTEGARLTITWYVNTEARDVPLTEEVSLCPVCVSDHELGDFPWRWPEM